MRSVLERMSTQFKLEIETRPPRIPYRETITAPAGVSIVTRSRPAAPASS
jgi:translation elongation factor EF-G